MTIPGSTYAANSPLAVVERPISSLAQYANNPRKNDAVVERMVASIREFGFAVPILAESNGTVIDGHLRLKAAIRLGMESVPVIVCDNWTPPQVKAFRLLANRSVTWADWDIDALKLEFQDLQSFNFDLALTGFEPEEWRHALHSGVGLTDEDAVPDPPKTPITKPGDLWGLGPHRLLCGDCTASVNVARLLGNVEPGLMVTDPPYGVNYDPTWRDDAGGVFGNGKTVMRGKVANDSRVDWAEAFALFSGQVAYVWHAARHASEVQRSLENCGFEIKSQIVWAKQHFVLSRGGYHWQHEPCWYSVRKGAKTNWTGDRTQSTLWQIANLNPAGRNQAESVKTGHGTQKPVECMRRPILNHTNSGQGVYDPFVGSGTTIIAAEATGRVCFAMDVEPVYVDVAVERWQAYTGRQAVRLDA